MVKKSKINKETQRTVIALGIIIILAAVFLSISKGETVFSATMVSPRGNAITHDSAESSMAYARAQSLFGLDTKTVPFYIQSTVPNTEEEEGVILRAVTSNIFKEAAYLRYVSVKKNGEELYTENIAKFLQPGETYIYKTHQLDLEGKKSQINSITMDFVYQKTDGESGIQQFQYTYFSLDPCLHDNDCVGTGNPVCDLSNLARFSKGDEFYCVRPCIDNQQCYEGQVCIKGRCGY